MAVQQAMSLAQFMVWLGTQEMKHEYDRGRVMPHIVAMPGGLVSYNRIELNLVREIAVAFEESPYEAFTSNQLLATQNGEVAFFPDAVLMDGPPQTIRYGTQQAATNPAVVFEIASASTRGYDEGRKLDVYRSIPTMREIVLIDSTRIRAVRWFRKGAGWDREEIIGLDAKIPVLGIEIPMMRIYKNVKLPLG